MYCVTQFRTIVQASLYSTLCCAPGDELLDSFETCRADKKNSGIEIDYKNCASRCSVTHY